MFSKTLNQMLYKHENLMSARSTILIHRNNKDHYIDNTYHQKYKNYGINMNLYTVKAYIKKESQFYKLKL